MALWLACAVQAAFLVIASILNGTAWFITPEGRPQASDFAAYRVAAEFAWRGDAAAAYDWTRFSAALAAVFGDNLEHALGWLNPPVFFLAVTPFALPPFALAFVLWLVATGALFAFGLRRINAAPGMVALGFAAPAAFHCIAKGQSGFLSAGLMALALAPMPSRPILAGAWLGMLAYKPHLAAGLGLLVLLSGRWRVALGAALSVGVLVMLTTLVFGMGVWTAFLASVSATSGRFLGQSLALNGIQSVFGFVMMQTGDRGVSMAVHLAVACAGLAVALPLWWRPTSCWDATAAAGIAATLLATPYAFDHDAVVLTTAIAFLLRAALRDGWMKDEAAMLGLAALLPLANLASPINLLVPAASALVLAVAVRRAAATRHSLA